jgi:hypothetical protein
MRVVSTAGVNRPVLRRRAFLRNHTTECAPITQTKPVSLFTYQTYPELNMPNTTNTIDGYFASLKKKIAAHHGARRDRRYKVISELLKKS